MSEAPFRRVVTGHDDAGKAIILSDGPPPRVIDTGSTMPKVYELWSTLESPVRVSRRMSEPAEENTLPPPPGGTRARIIDFPPDGQATAEDIEHHFNAMNAASVRDSNGEIPHQMMHRTQSVDIAIVLQGEIVLIMDEGETLVRPGDTIIQCGTNHSWSNRSQSICRMAFFMIDGKFDPDIA